MWRYCTVPVFTFLFCVFMPVWAAAEQSMLSRYDLAKPDAVLKLPAELKEISGITVNEDGGLFGHDDEKGTIYQLDPEHGGIIKRFFLLEKRWFGDDPIIGDFEDIAAAGSRFYLVTSGGVLYSFYEGKDGEKVIAARQETFLNDLFDVEGLCYDPDSNTLLLACKEYPVSLSFKELFSGRKKSRMKEKPVYSFLLEQKVLLKEPRFLLSSKKLKKSSRQNKFKPSAIARHPQSGTFFILASRGRLLVELSPEGEILGTARLPAGYHPQPEGIAFMRDNAAMLISNEGVGTRATLLRYSPDDHSAAVP